MSSVINDQNITLQRRGIGSIGDISTAGLDDLIKKSKWPGSPNKSQIGSQTFYRHKKGNFSMKV